MERPFSNFLQVPHRRDESQTQQVTMCLRSSIAISARGPILMTTFVCMIVFWLIGGFVYAASPTPVLLKAKQVAESKGYTFLTSHDEIVARAKKEGKLRVVSGLDTTMQLREAFVKRYPFIDAYAEERSGSAADQRLLLEMQGGRAHGWDSNSLSSRRYNEWLPYEMKFDVLGMASQGILNVPLELVDPVNRNIVATAGRVRLAAYNKTMMSEAKVPNTWEDFLKPEFRGRKFGAYAIRATDFSALVPAWGLEKTLDFARKIASQEPIWLSGEQRLLAALGAAEFPLFFGASLQLVVAAQRKDPIDRIGYKVLEPVPMHHAHTHGVLATADHPYAALLWLEFLVSPEGQKVMEDREPGGASFITPGTLASKLTKGKRLSIMSWEHYANVDEWDKKVVEALGFPKPEK